MSATIEQLQEALNLMSSNSPDKKKALQHLEEFQKTSEAWSVVHSILQSNSSATSLELKMFAAQTLRNKMTYDLAQLPEESMPGLKDSLIDFIILYETGSKPIRTQLSIALAKLSIQYLSWENPVEEIMGKLQNDIPALLDFLKILPEETLDPRGTLLTDEEFRVKVDQLITVNIEKVVLLLSNYSQSTDNSKAHSLILECLNSWISEIPVEQLLQVESLTSVIFKSLSQEDSFEKAVECLSTIVRETRDIDNVQLIQALYSQIIQLRPLLTQSHDDPDAFGSLTNLFVNAGEAWHILIAKFPEQFKDLVEIILQCSAYDEDLDVVEYTFYFWYELKQMVTLERYSQAKLAFTPVYTQLIHVMIKHLKYPSTDTFDTKEEEDKFKDFRYAMGDVLKDCTAVIGDSSALSIPYELMTQAIATVDSATGANWQEVEAPLFSLRAMAQAVKLKESQVMPKIMQLIVSGLPEVVKIRYAATLVLGRYTEWTSKNPSFLEPQLTYIISGFQSAATTDIITAASHALMYFCRDCSKLLSDYIEQLYSFYQNVMQATLQTPLGSARVIDLDSVYEISEGLAHIVNQQPAERVSDVATMFIKPIIDQLTTYTSMPAGNEQVNIRIAEEIEIVRLFMEFVKPRDASYETPTDPVADLIISLWPLVLQLLSVHGGSSKVAERCMKFTKTILTSYNIYLSPIIGSIAEQLVRGFQTTRFGCYLWVSGVVIKVFGDDYVPADTKASIWKFAYEQITTYLQMYATVGNVDDIPDLVEDFARMLDDIIVFFVPDFILSDLLSPVFQTCLHSLANSKKYEPVLSTLQFLIDLISWGFDHPPISIFEELPDDVKLTVRKHINSDNAGGVLITTVLKGLIFTFPSDTHLDSTDLITKTIRLAGSPDTAVHWLDSALASLPQGSVGEKERTKLLSTVSAALSSKDFRRVRTGLKDFVGWYSRKNITPRFQK
ncbi:hypothetical protein WICPIJ_001868 [Wickerhamomyces pijperi]|uniref:Importin N-terminal domain-containing protein n=1 Tax=Wickerhamomyces pijperi TaxID=599730 RepID=A0A9P8TPG9_WICPI|nr:hypothetical protein WICPIJ_001868 [Wickerhamomyces pijperi]